MSMSPQDHGQTKLHKWTLTQKLHTNIGKQLLSEIMLCDDTSKEVAGTYRSFARALLHAHVWSLSTVCGHGQGSGAPPSRLTHAAES